MIHFADADVEHFLAGGGEMGERIREHDWSATPFGPIGGWPQSLRSALSICLRAAAPTAIYWGPEFRLLYNDAWAPIPGPRHPAALGRPGAEVWADIWPLIGEQFARVLEKGESVVEFDRLLPMARFGRAEELYFDYSLTPIAIENGAIGGILNQAHETTAKVFSARFDAAMRALDERLREAATVPAKIEAALAVLGECVKAGRTGYAEIDGPDAVLIHRCWTAGPMPDIGGHYPIGAFGEKVSDALVRGEVVRIDDTDLDERTSDPATRALYASIRLRSGIVVPLITGGRYAAAIFAQTEAPRGWSDHDEALIGAVGRRLWQDVARARAETALRDSEQRHRLIFEQAHDIILTADTGQIITSCNPAGARAMGTEASEIVGRSIADFVSPAGFEQTTAMLRHKLEHGGETAHELTVTRRDGHEMRWEVVSTLATDRDGKPIGLQAIARDVTERRAFQRRQQLLINELNHRVKNTLALVQSLALQTFKPGREPARAAADFEGRLRALAAAHDLLTREQWEGTVLGELVASAIGPHADGSRITAAGPTVAVSPKAAVSIIMALHELCTNAAKYGALSAAEGRVDIGWSVGGGRFRLEWRESGGPAVGAPGQSGFGVRMIERALAADLQGNVAIDFAPAGLVCTIDAPLPAAAPR